MRVTGRVRARMRMRKKKCSVVVLERSEGEVEEEGVHRATTLTSEVDPHSVSQDEMGKRNGLV
jgi:hypothetical protein